MQGAAGNTGEGLGLSLLSQPSPVEDAAEKDWQQPQHQLDLLDLLRGVARQTPDPEVLPLGGLPLGDGVLQPSVGHEGIVRDLGGGVWSVCVGGGRECV